MIQTNTQVKPSPKKKINGWIIFGWVLLLLVLTTSLGVNIYFLIFGLQSKRALGPTFDNDNCGQKCHEYAKTSLPKQGEPIALFCTELIQTFETSMKKNTSVDFPEGVKKVQVLQYNSSSKPDIGWILKDVYDRVWVIFRGTQSAEEGAQDLLFGYATESIFDSGLYDEEHYALHKGFVNVFNSFRNVLHRTIEKLNPTDLIITGHSLGAALATLAIFSFRERPKVIGYGFGSPRVGDVDFVTLFNSLPHSEWYNVINLDDIFTSLPLSVMANKAKPEQPLLYQQAGILITFSKNWGSYLANHLLPVYQNYLLAGHTGT